MKYPKWLIREMVIACVVIAIILAVMIPAVINELARSEYGIPALLALVVGFFLGGIIVAWAYYSSRSLPEQKP